MKPEGTQISINGSFGCGGAGVAGLYTAVDHQQAVETFQAAQGQGVNYLDSALLYGGGNSLRALGEALGEKPQDNIVLSFKVGRVLVDGEDDPAAKGKKVHPINGFSGGGKTHFYYDYSAEGVQRAFEQSMHMLNEGRAAKGMKILVPEDLNLVVYAHDPGVGEHGNHQPAIMRQVLNEAFPVLHKMQREGKILGYGVGTNEVAPAKDALRDPHVSMIMLAGRGTLYCNGAHAAPEEIRQDAQHLGHFVESLGKHRAKPRVVVAAIGNSGLVYPGGSTYNYKLASPEVLAYKRDMEGVVAGFNEKNKTRIPMIALAAQYPLRAYGESVAAVVPGPRSPAELKDAIGAIQQPMPEELWETLEKKHLIAPAMRERGRNL